MRIRRAASLAILASLCAIATSCATILPGHDTYAFQECQRRYTQYVRWARFDDATAFVEEEALGNFVNQISSFGEVRFTDYRVRSLDMDTMGFKATVLVTYYAYQRTSPLPIAFDEAQHWTRTPGTRSWAVRSTFAQRPLQPGEDMF